MHWASLRSFYGAKWWSVQRQDKKRREQRALAKIADQLLGTDRSKIAVFGDGAYGGTMKGVGPTPVSKIRDFLAKQGRVVLVDEYRTSQACCGCHSQLVRSRRDFTTLHCGVESMTWNRDVNASRNIALLFKCKMLGLERPACMQPRRPEPAWLHDHLAVPAWTVLLAI